MTLIKKNSRNRRIQRKYDWTIFIKKATFCIILTLFSYPSFSQKKHLYTNAQKYGYTNLDSGLYYYQLLDSAAIATQDTQMMIVSRIYLASRSIVNRNFDHANSLIESALPLTKDSTLINLLEMYGTTSAKYDVVQADSIYEIACELSESKFNNSLKICPTLFNNYANFLEKRGDLSKSIIYFTKALEYAPTDFARLQSINSLLNLFSVLENTQRMEDYINQGVEIAERNNFKSRNGLLALNHAILYSLKGEYSNAKSELDRANQYESKYNQKSWLFNTLHTKKIFFKSQNKWPQIDSLFMAEAKNIANFESENNPFILLTRGEIALYNNELETAKKLGVLAMSSLKKNNTKKNLQYAYQLLANVNEKQGNLENSIKFKKHADSISNIYYSITQSDYVTYTEAKFKRKEQHKQIVDLDNENQTKNKVLAIQEKAIIFGGLSLLLISILLFFLYRLYLRVNKQKEVISKALSDKDILLREIHHRVKNNLQLVSSLLTLQGRSIDNDLAQQAINEGKNRVRSMALIHQDLYNKENLMGIGVKEYLEKLTKELVSTYNIDNDKIILANDIHDINLDLDTMVPLGLIINELISNSLKYAFPNSNPGQINIRLHELDGQLTLSIKDNGVGYKNESVRENSFGSTLVTALTEQLEGEIKIDSTNGTETIIIFHSYNVV